MLESILIFLINAYKANKLKINLSLYNNIYFIKKLIIKQSTNLINYIYITKKIVKVVLLIVYVGACLPY